MLGLAAVLLFFASPAIVGAQYLPPSHHMPGFHPSYHDEYRNYGPDKRIVSYGYRFGDAYHKVEVNFNRPSAFGVYGPPYGVPMRPSSVPGVATWGSKPANHGWTQLNPVQRPVHQSMWTMQPPSLVAPTYDYLWPGRR
ncbi:uncharacterized protein LOC135947485 [Cloeon dipterum]|uniref:uncharacterized protein LOC135947485 n=1 Tax=Cloeon dipterum TaxID=197152 RepID=UPI00322006D9